MLPKKKKADMGMQKCQKLFMAAMYAILEASRGACGTIKANLVHALVLILSGNREVNLKRRELLRPDLNAQFSALFNLSTPISKELFGDDVGKEIEEVAKANRLGEKSWLHTRKVVFLVNERKSVQILTSCSAYLVVPLSFIRSHCLPRTFTRES